MNTMNKFEYIHYGEGARCAPYISWPLVTDHWPLTTDHFLNQEDGL